MTRREIYTEILRLDEELRLARRRMKDAQLRAKATGVRLPNRDFVSLWNQIHDLERAIETEHLHLSTAQEAAAEQFVGIVKVEYPAVFARVASRAGVEP